MAKKTTKKINISITPISFTSIFSKLKGQTKYDFSDIHNLRRLLSNERAKILYTIKNEEPASLYKLAKLLKRDFKSVRQDVLLLQEFGFIKLEKAITKQRKSLKPVLLANSLQINFEF